MEKRTILAFFLSFLVLIGWSLLFRPGPDQALRKGKVGPEPKLEDEPRPVEPGPRVTQGPSPATEKLVVRDAPALVEKEVHVDTPLYAAVFTNMGPSIKSFKLKKYFQSTAPESPPVELVNLENDMGHSLLISFQSVSDFPNETIAYQVDQHAVHLNTGSSAKELVFHSSTPEGISTRQVFRFYPDQYRIDLNVVVLNQSARPLEGTFATQLRALPPQKKGGYYSFNGMAVLLNGELEQLKLKKAPAEEILNGNLDWMAYEDNYFISAVVPEKPFKGIFKARLLNSGLLEGTFLPSSFSVSPSEQGLSSYVLYFGPRDLAILKEQGKNLDRAISFGWTDIIAKPLLYLLRFFDSVIGNYGVSIILLTVLVKILFWPLTQKSYKSMKEMQKLQPRLAKIREKYKDDKQQINKEMMALYKTYKVNPMGGCLPMIIQIPVFFALYRILGSAIELRHAPFMLWIDDLSAPDRLFNFPFKIPFMSAPYGIPVLTLLMGASMFVQQRMTPTPGDPTQAKFMMLLPIIFTFMFINFPSGLVLYWLVNNVLSIGQQYWINKSSA